MYTDCKSAYAGSIPTPAFLLRAARYAGRVLPKREAGSPA